MLIRGFKGFSATFNSLLLSVPCRFFEPFPLPTLIMKNIVLSLDRMVVFLYLADWSSTYGDIVLVLI